MINKTHLNKITKDTSKVTLLVNLLFSILFLLSSLASCSSSSTTEAETEQKISGTVSYNGVIDNKYEGYTNVAITPLTLDTISGDYVASIEPALPSGLSFDTGSGTISGTPTNASSNQYTVTATGTGDYTGSRSGSIIIVISVPNTRPFSIVEKDNNPLELTISYHDQSMLLVGATNWGSSDVNIATVVDGVVSFTPSSSLAIVTITATIGAYSTNKVVSSRGKIDDSGNVIIEEGSQINLIVSESTKNILENVYKSRGLTSVILPNSLLTISRDSFSKNSLTNLIVPESVTNIDDGAFQNNQLKSLTLGNSLKVIGDNAFRDNQLTDIIIPNSVRLIDNGAFRGNQLTSVIIGNSVTNIDDGAFQNNQLTSLIIPDSVVKISYGAFLDNNLQNVNLGNSLEIIDIAAFTANQLTSITIPDSVKTIGNGAFKENPSLTNVTLSVTLYTNLGASIRTDIFGSQVSNWYKLDGTPQ